MRGEALLAQSGHACEEFVIRGKSKHVLDCGDGLRPTSSSGGQAVTLPAKLDGVIERKIFSLFRRTQCKLVTGKPISEKLL